MKRRVKLSAVHWVTFISKPNKHPFNVGFAFNPWVSENLRLIRRALSFGPPAFFATGAE